MTMQVASSPAGGVVREGDRIIVPRVLGNWAGAPLPPACVKCGRPSARPLSRSFYWHAPWVYLLILPGLLFYAIVALATRKRMDLQIPLCASHRSRRRNQILAAWLLAAAGVGAIFLFGALELDMGIGALVMIALILAGAIMGVLVSSPLRPVRIDDRCGVFKGCAEPFLRQVR
jgi:hypothetical protein